MNATAAAAYVQQHHTFLLVAHQSPDGDTLGSCLALRLALLSLGKQVTVACCDPVPERLRFLCGADAVQTELEEPFSAAVLYVDCADHRRAGALAPICEAQEHQFGIDHHMTNPQNSKDGDWVERRGATGELILELLERLNVTVTRQMAECLFTAIATDTGNFAYSNTTEQTFQAAAKLSALGVDLPELNRRLFRSMPLSKAKLIADILTEMELLCGDSVGMVGISEEMLRACGAKEEDCEGLIDYIRDIETVEVACVLRESKDGTVRVSLRSKHSFDVSAVAARFGGGGHMRAAGCTLSEPLAEAKRIMKAALLQAVSV